MNELPFIDAPTVRRILSMDACIDLMADTQAAISRGEITLPPRSFIPVADGRGTMGLMPGEIPSGFGAKLISLYPENPRAGLPAIQGCIVLFDRNTGTPAALIDGASVTAIRTAAASGAATRALARDDAAVLAILGYGVQAGTHLEAMRCVRPLREVRVWGPSVEKARNFVRQQATEGLAMAAVETACEAIAGADIVCSVSSATEPIIEGRRLESGCHLNVVGAHTPTTRETDGETLRRARVFTEITGAAMRESGDLLLAIEEGMTSANDVCGEIGDVFDGRIAGRRNDDEITLYVSLGNTAQDLAAAFYVAGKEGVSRAAR